MFARASLAIAALTAACSSSVDEPVTAQAPDDAASGSNDGRYGLLVMTHDEGDPGVSVSGQFAAWEDQAQALVLHALAVPETAWLVADIPGSGECRGVAAPRQAVFDGAVGHIELLAAGDLTIKPPAESFSGSPLELAPREFPRVLFSLGGVVYDADAPESLPFVERGVYSVAATGDEVGPISARIDAPGSVKLIGQHVVDGGLSVRWQGDAEVIITLARELSGETRGVQCRAPAGGEFTVPEADLLAFGPGDAQLTVAEVTRRRTHVNGLDSMDLFFVSRDQAVVRLPASPAND